jgi:hypothetical protein
MPKPIDLDRLTPAQLKNLLSNAQRIGEATVANDVVREMARRGIASHSEYRTLHWNQQRIREIMEPFKEIASAVRSNQRTPYTEAGGLRIGRSRDDPEHMWIDTYSAIKTSRVNAVFGCYIRQPGDEPEFRLYLEGNSIRSFNADDLSDALDKWRLIARDATPDGIMRARPVVGDVDHEALSREFIARFPKLRAALAK